jgi:hypothetical protein
MFAIQQRRMLAEQAAQNAAKVEEAYGGFMQSASSNSYPASASFLQQLICGACARNKQLPNQTRSGTASRRRPKRVGVV